MRSKWSLIVVVALVAVVLTSATNVTTTCFVDRETNAGNTFRAWILGEWIQTTQADFQAGVLSQVDVLSNPGAVKLGTTSNNVTDSFNDGSKIASMGNLTITNPVGQVKLTVGSSATETLRPNGAGSSTQLTAVGASPNYACVDEAIANDNTDYVRSSTTSMWYDSYATTDHSVGVGNISNVTLWIRVRNESGFFAASFRTRLTTHSTNYNGTTYTPTGTGWYEYSQVYTTNPNTGLAWTWSDVDAMEIGVGIQGAATQNGRRGRCTQVWAVVAYQPYNSPGTLTSTNLLSGLTVASIDSFGYNASAIPSGTGLQAQFSQDNTNWYNSAGTLSGWDTLSQGTHTISLSSLGWSGANLYYKMRFTSNGSDTPVLDDVSVTYSYYYTSGTVASAVLDCGAAGARWGNLSWDETLPTNTDITFEVRASDTQFLKNAATPSWTSVGGTSPVSTGLPTGRYKQWRATLTTSDTSKTPMLLEVRVYYY